MLRYTIILNHPRGWGGKPQGSHADSRVAEISDVIFGPGVFFCMGGITFAFHLGVLAWWGLFLNVPGVFCDFTEITGAGKYLNFGTSASVWVYGVKDVY